MKKITLATIKSFIRKNRANLYIKNVSSFDGMTDCVQRIADAGFVAATETNSSLSNTAGVNGAWFVGGSRDYFNAFEADGFIGYSVSNCCGSFYLAIKADAPALAKAA